MLFSRTFLASLAILAAATPLTEARAQAAPDGAYRIVWEVKNRFRLFREEKDFVLHAEALRGQNILDAEYDLAVQSEGRGWARNTRAAAVHRSRRARSSIPAIATACARTISARQNTASACGSKAPGTSVCNWHFARGDGSVRDVRANCNAETQVEIPYGRPTEATVEITRDDGTAATRTRIDRRARPADRGAWRLDRRRRRQSRTARSRWPTTVSASASSSAQRAANISGPAAPATRATALAIRAAPNRNRRMPGTSSPRAGRMQHATARSTAIRCARRSRSRSSIRMIAVTFLPLACTGATIEAGTSGPDARARTRLRRPQMSGQRARAAHAAHQPAGAGAPARPEPRARPYFSHGRRQRHRIFQSRRRRHHRRAVVARIVQARRRDRQCGDSRKPRSMASCPPRLRGFARR